MNRIRVIDSNNIQVLTTPLNRRFDAGFEYLLNSWSEAHLKTYIVKTYDNMDSALEEAFKYPNISWDTLVLMHKDQFIELKNLVETVIEENKMICDITPMLMTPKQVKYMMFDRILRGGIVFKLSWLMNNVFGYHIINPYYENLKELASKLKNIPELRIKKIYESNKVIRLVGRTNLETDYEIVLWTTTMAQFARWLILHPDVETTTMDSMLNEAIEQQNQIDEKYLIR